MKENSPNVGLGSMGGGMARSLVRAGLATHGFDVEAALVTDFCAEGGQGGSFSEAGPSLDIVATVVVNAEQTEMALFGENGLASVLRKGAVILSCATVSPDFARAMESRCIDLGLLYLDAPISGGSVKAGQGALSIMASGSDAAFEAAQPALDAMAENVFRLGDTAGSGSALKVINQMLAGVHIAAAAEAITFGISQGVDPQTTVDVISKCAGSSWVFENRGPHIADRISRRATTHRIPPSIFLLRIWVLCPMSPGPRSSRRRSPPRPCSSSLSLLARAMGVRMTLMSQKFMPAMRA